jgi:hypothetical protein
MSHAIYRDHGSSLVIQNRLREIQNRQSRHLSESSCAPFAWTFLLLGQFAKDPME